MADLFLFSRFYGGTLSETVLGNCLSELKVPREEFIVSTKCGRYKDGFDFSAQRVIRSIDESLARLKLDYVDILHCHDIEFGSLDQVLFYPMISSSLSLDPNWLFIALVDRGHSCLRKWPNFMYYLILK